MTEPNEAERKDIIVALDEAVKAGASKVRTNFLLDRLGIVNREILFESLITKKEEI